jgi:hypothetical protein
MTTRCDTPAPIQLRCVLPTGHDGPHSLGDTDTAAVADLRGLFAELIAAWGPYECCTHPERRNGCWGLLPWDEEGWLVSDPCNWCLYAHAHVEATVTRSAVSTTTTRTP